ncbi:hypothetical protein N665_0193s0012 [Sinapis alba]|nr:hypothetical protein N665_0193s0012 [Sinapis alba]
MTQTTEGAFELIENMTASSSNKNQKTDRSRKVNSIDTTKIDELTDKVDQLIKSNQSHVFIMEEAAPEEDQQEVSYANGQVWQFKNYHPNPNMRTNPQLFFYKNNAENPADKGHNTGYQKGYSQNYQENPMFSDRCRTGGVELVSDS